MSVDFLPNRATPSQIEYARIHMERRARLYNPPAPKPKPIFIPPPVLEEVEPTLEPAPKVRDVLALGNGPFRWKAIADEVCKKHGIQMQFIRGENRSKPTCAARHELCYRLYTETGMSYPQIGRFLSKDHSTVLHSVRRHKAILEAGE